MFEEKAYSNFMRLAWGEYMCWQIYTDEKIECSKNYIFRKIYGKQ